MDTKLLEKVIDDLGAISVPNALLVQIAIPIHNARQDLIRMYDYMKSQNKEEATNERDVVGDGSNVVPIRDGGSAGNIQEE